MPKFGSNHAVLRIDLEADLGSNDKRWKHCSDLRRLGAKIRKCESMVVSWKFQPLIEGDLIVLYSVQASIECSLIETIFRFTFVKDWHVEAKYNFKYEIGIRKNMEEARFGSYVG